VSGIIITLFSSQRFSVFIMANRGMVKKRGHPFTPLLPYQNVSIIHFPSSLILTRSILYLLDFCQSVFK
jgi:hypothetical protein